MDRYGISSFDVNGRFVHGRVTGVQRYAWELLKRMPEARVISNDRPMSGAIGHAWEQFVLPFRSRGRLLWSPCNTGPLSVSQQVVTMHDMTPVDHPEWMSKRFSEWYRYLVPRLARRVRRIITDSDYSKERIISISGVSPDKIISIPLAADDRFCPADPEVVEKVSRRFGLEPSKYVLSVSSIEPRKNLPRLLNAWSRILSEIPDDICLVLAGAKGSEAVFGEFRLDGLPPRVEFTGYIPDDDLPGLYSGALGFIYISLYEGFGLPPLEAMACGTPVLSSSATSLPEVVGDSALTVDPEDDEAIAFALKQLILDGDLRSHLRASGITRARQFSWDTTAKQSRQVLQESSE